jgi:hypothetical protein
MDAATITDAIESESSDEEDKGPLSKFGFGKVDHEGIAEELLGIGGKWESKSLSPFFFHCPHLCVWLLHARHLCVNGSSET